MKVDPTLDLSEAGLMQGSKTYEDWHWGVEGQKVVDWKDSDMPATLIESVGRLIRMHVRAPGGGTHPRRKTRYDDSSCLKEASQGSSHVAFRP